MPETRPTVDVRTATPTKQLVIERALKASPERVFDAFTDPDQLEKWWWPNGFTCPAAEVDLRLGGTYRLAMEWPSAIPAAQQFSHHMGGEYYAIERPHRLVMSGRAVNDEQGELFATLIEVTIEARDGGTALTIRQSYFEPMPPAEAMGGAEQGWSEQLGKLERLLGDRPREPGTRAEKLETAEADIVYDVRGPLPTLDGRPPLFMVGQPMDAGGFRTLASYFPDRTVITYDPRGLGRSMRKDGRVDHVPTVQAIDVHAVISALGVGAVEMFASSGGAVTALALVAAYPDDVTVLVAHEPPLIPVLPDAEAAERARTHFRDAYMAKGRGAGMAAFIAMTSWQGEFTEDFLARPTPDPVQFGLPSEDDGSRDDPVLSDRSWAVSSYRPDVDALVAAPTRIVIAAGEESIGTFTGRAAAATAERLGQRATVFPSHHGGFMGGDSGYAGRPEAFARKLRDVLTGDN